MGKMIGVRKGSTLAVCIKCGNVYIAEADKCPNCKKDEYELIQ